jgi:hypothetical protein
MYKNNTVICVELEVWSRWTTVFNNDSILQRQYLTTTVFYNDSILQRQYFTTTVFLQRQYFTTTVFYNAVKESEYINRSTDNTIAKKGERTIYKTYT